MMIKFRPVTSFEVQIADAPPVRMQPNGPSWNGLLQLVDDKGNSLIVDANAFEGHAARFGLLWSTFDGSWRDAEVFNGSAALLKPEVDRVKKIADEALL